MYIAKKYNSDSDVIYTFDYCMANSLYTFKTVALYANTGEYVSEDVLRPYDQLVLSSTVTDNIGPAGLRIDGLGYWTGGNHLFTDSLGIKHKTAKTIDVEISVNDSVMTNDFSCYAPEIKIIVSNNLYFPPELPEKNICIKENVEYTVDVSGIRVFSNHNIFRKIYITNYYGMQSAGSALQEKIFMINSQYQNEINKEDGLQSGPITSYPNVYKTILSDSLKTICQEMMINMQEGLFSNPDTYIVSPSSFSRVFTSGSKTYFNQIRGKQFYQGDNYFWKGRYSWYDMNEYCVCSPESVLISSDGQSNKIIWDDSPGAETYKIYRSTDPYSGFVVLGSVSVPEFTDMDISGSDMYFYRITAKHSQ
ncbi:MAG: hypothetical protein R6V47_04725 [Candidatus Delongbacteria bacterium]